MKGHAMVLSSSWHAHGIMFWKTGLNVAESVGNILETTCPRTIQEYFPEISLNTRNCTYFPKPGHIRMYIT